MSATAEAPFRESRRLSLFHPAIIFAVLSMTFGALIIFLSAPLRGPDEAAHFLRAYGVAAGDIVPSEEDGAGRKGVLLPVRLHREFAAFEAAYATERRAHWSH